MRPLRSITSQVGKVDPVPALRLDPISVDHDCWWPDDVEKLTKAVKEMGEKSLGRMRSKG
jgi:hypothetical protein